MSEEKKGKNSARRRGRPGASFRTREKPRFTSRGRRRTPFGGRRGGVFKKELTTEEKLKEMQASAPGIEEIAPENESLKNWVPRTEAGRLVRAGEITSMEEVWAKHLPILEGEIIEMLVPDLQEKVIDTRKTAYVRAAGRKFNFSAFVLVGDGKRYIGLGMGSDKERFPAIRKATRDAKLKLIPVHVGSGSWEDFSENTRSVPFKVTGKSGSVRVTLQPAPKGTGLVVGKQIQDVFRFAGITDVWGKTKGSSDTKLNYVRAAYNALERLNKVRMSPDMQRKLSKQMSAGVHA